MDGFTWKGNLDGVYSVKVGYKWLIKWNSHVNEIGLWKWIWRLATPEKIKFLYWTVCHDVFLRCCCCITEVCKTLTTV
jgi:hypothetical protein